MGIINAAIIEAAEDRKKPNAAINQLIKPKIPRSGLISTTRVNKLATPLPPLKEKNIG